MVWKKILVKATTPAIKIKIPLKKSKKAITANFIAKDFTLNLTNNFLNILLIKIIVG